MRASPRWASRRPTSRSWIDSAAPGDIDAVEAFLLGDCSEIEDQARGDPQPLLRADDRAQRKSRPRADAGTVRRRRRRRRPQAGPRPRDPGARRGHPPPRSATEPKPRPCDVGEIARLLRRPRPDGRRRVLPLPRRERRILEYLVGNRGRRVTKSQIFNAIYGIFDEDVEENVIESHISKLRKKLRAPPRLRPDRIPSAISATGSSRESGRRAAIPTDVRPRTMPAPLYADQWHCDAVARQLRASLAVSNARCCRPVYPGDRTNEPIRRDAHRRTSGMTAQANRLSAVADNIANSNTTGYKRASTEFASLIIDNSTGDLHFRRRQDRRPPCDRRAGQPPCTTSVTDLAIKGNGFFVVSDGDGTPFLTRAGSFVPDGSGNLINAAGFNLMGYRHHRRRLRRRRQRHRRPRGRQRQQPGAQGQPDRRRARSRRTCRPTADAVAAGDLPSANAAGAAVHRARPRSSPTTISARR